MSTPVGSSQWMYSTPSGFYPYLIDQSLRFNKPDNAHLSKTYGTAGNRKTFTISCWIKRSNLSNNNIGHICASYDGSSTRQFRILFNSSDQLQFGQGGSGTSGIIATNAVFRDTSAWYHCVFVADYANSTAADRAIIYVNGERQSVSTTSSFLDANGHWLSTYAMRIGRIGTSDVQYFDGYMAEFHCIDGTALDPTSFGETINGVWVPKQYSGSYGTNGFYLSFADSSAIGDDLSGNTNDWTANNLAASDVVPDSPTNNFGTMNVLDKNSMTLTEGNLRVTPTADYKAVRGTFGIPTSGKWYFEARVITGGGGNVQDNHIGITTSQNVLTGSSPYPQSFTYGVGYLGVGQINRAGSVSQTGLTTFSVGTILGVAVNLDDNEIQFYINGTTEGTTETLVSTAEPNFAFYVGATNRSSQFNFGQDSTFAGAISAGGNADANGYGDFAYAPPSGFLALCSANLDEPSIGPNSTTTSDEHFNTVTYTGTGASNSITVGFQPDFTWIKSRSNAYNHQLVNSVVGYPNGTLLSDASDAEYTAAARVDSRDSNGFTVSTPAQVNLSSGTFVSWNWKAGGTAVSNTSGSITSQVSANQDAGFSIATWTGNQTAGATVGHGLSQAPEMYIVKARGAAASWAIYHSALGATKWMLLNSTQAATTSAQEWNNTEPTSTVVSLGNSSANSNQSVTYVGYFFHSSDVWKVGSYVGNGNADGTFVYTGFRPAFVLLKVSSAVNNWFIYDNKREGYNQDNDTLSPNLNSTEDTSYKLDLVSNGFKIRGSQNAHNQSGQTFIYLAFAESPFKYANAR